MNTVERRQVSILLGIVVEKRKSSHRWADWVWRPVSVFQTDDRDAAWAELLRKDNMVRYHAGTLPLTLHRKETEALRANLMLDVPELYIVLQEDEEGHPDFPWMPHVVTASPFEAQDYEDAGEYLIDKVPMSEAVAALVQAFVEQHHVDEEFRKRRRDRLDLEEQKFGKAPIFTPLTKH